MGVEPALGRAEKNYVKENHAPNRKDGDASSETDSAILSSFSL